MPGLAAASSPHLPNRAAAALPIRGVWSSRRPPFAVKRLFYPAAISNSFSRHPHSRGGAASFSLFHASTPVFWLRDRIKLRICVRF